MGGIIFFLMKRGGGGKASGDAKTVEGMVTPQSSTEVKTFVYAYEASGLFSILRPLKEEATHITFKYGGEEWSPKKTHPFTPAGSQTRFFHWATGADSCDDPARMHGERDIDDPESLIQEATHWFRSIRAAIGSLGVSLKNPFLILLLFFLGFMALGAGYILGNAYPLR